MDPYHINFVDTKDGVSFFPWLSAVFSIGAIWAYRVHSSAEIESLKRSMRRNYYVFITLFLMSIAAQMWLDLIPPLPIISLLAWILLDALWKFFATRNLQRIPVRISLEVFATRYGKEHLWRGIFHSVLFTGLSVWILVSNTIMPIALVTSVIAISGLTIVSLCLCIYALRLTPDQS